MRGFQKGTRHGAVSLPAVKAPVKSKAPEPIIALPWSGGKASLRLRDEVYQMDIIPEFGERIRRSTKEHDPALAMQMLLKVVGQVDRGEAQAVIPVTKKAKVTLLDSMQNFLDHYEKKHSPETHDSYRLYIKNLFGPRFGHLKPSEISTPMINAYRAQRVKEYTKNGKNRAADTPVKTNLVSHTTVDRELAFLKAVLNWQRRNNPAIVPSVPYFEMMKLNNTRKGFISIAQFARDFLPQLPFHTKALCCCAILWGGRRSEWLSLDWPDIDFRNRVIHFNHTKSDDPREVEIIPGLMEELLVELKQFHDATCPEQKAVFTYKGRRLKEFKTSWDTAKRKAGAAQTTMEAGDMDITNLMFHDTRRSAGKIMRDANMTQEEIMSFMGHKTDSMFRRYGIKPKNALRRGGQMMRDHLATIPEVQVLSALETSLNESGVYEAKAPIGTLKEAILRMRTEGHSYREIEAKLQCSKSTIAFHCNEDQRQKSYDRKRLGRELQVVNEGEQQASC